jgi:hypothetical protein
MPSLKGLACVSLFTLAIAAPAFAQSNGSTPAAPPASTVSPGNSSATPGDQQSTPKAQRVHRRGRKSSTSQGQPTTSPSQ